jgi:hemolysin activation/secretion protein
MLLVCPAALAQQSIPSPSQVAPPVVPPAPGGARIGLPQVPAGTAAPAQAKKLSFRLLGFDVQGEFEELAAQRKELEAPLVGKRVTVADIFEFADKLQQAYVRAGYPLARVVILPQEFEQAARIKLRVIDGFIEKMNLDAIPDPVRRRVIAVLTPLVRKTHLKQSELERALLIAGETPGMILNATFAGGKEVGGSLLVLTGRYRPVSASLYGDNAMPKVFGTGQLVATAAFNSLLGYGEQLTVSAAGLPDRDFTTDDPTRRYLSGSLLVPIGIDGWKVLLGGANGVTTPRTNLNTRSQGLLESGYIRLSYDAIKSRNTEVSFNGRFDATDERLNSLVTDPPTGLSLDRLRVARGGFDALWRLRESGTTVSVTANYSRGMDAFGARKASDASFLLPLSRQGADVVFNKVDGRFDVVQSLPENFFVSAAFAGQTSFRNPLLKSEQFDLTGAKALSGFTAGALPGDAGWVARGEVGRAFSVPIESGGVTITPYGFVSHGERFFYQPTAQEVGNLHATNYGGGMRFNLVPWDVNMLDAYAFVEYSRRRTTNDVPPPTPGNTLNGDRVFAGALIRY